MMRISCCGETYDAGGLGKVPGGGSSLYDAGLRAGGVVLVSLDTQVAVPGPRRKAPLLAIATRRTPLGVRLAARCAQWQWHGCMMQYGVIVARMRRVLMHERG